MMDENASIRIPSDLIFVRIPQGVELRNSQDVCRLRGKNLYQALQRLSPQLDGSRTLAEICSRLAGKEADAVRNLCSILLGKGFLKAGPERGSMPAAEPFGGLVRYIDHFAGNAADRWRRFREASLLLAGDQLGLCALAHGLAELGLKRLQASAPSPACQARIRHYAEDGRRRGLDTGYRFLPDVNEVRLQDFEAVVFCAPTLDEQEIAAVFRRARRLRKVFLLGTIEQGRAVAGPLDLPEAPGCPWCARAGLAGQLPVSCSLPLRESPYTRVLLANELALELFRHLTGVNQTLLRGAVVAIDSGTLARTLFKLPVRAGCPECMPPTIETLQRG